MTQQQDIKKSPLSIIKSSNVSALDLQCTPSLKSTVLCDFGYRYFIFVYLTPYKMCGLLATGHTVHSIVLCSDDSSSTLQVHRGRDIGIQVVMVTIVHSTVSNTFRQCLATVSMHLMARLLDSTAEKSLDYNGCCLHITSYKNYMSTALSGRRGCVFMCMCVYVLRSLVLSFYASHASIRLYTFPQRQSLA